VDTAAARRYANYIGEHMILSSEAMGSWVPENGEASFGVVKG